jgi:hypothetical protein
MELDHAFASAVLAPHVEVTRFDDVFDHVLFVQLELFVGEQLVELIVGDHVPALVRTARPDHVFPVLKLCLRVLFEALPAHPVLARETVSVGHFDHFIADGTL